MTAHPDDEVRDGRAGGADGSPPPAGRIDDLPTEPDTPRKRVEISPPLARAGGRYTLEEQLGAGAGAVVWRAFDEVLGRSVAVKVLRPERAQDPTAVTAFLRAAAVAARAVHPGIVAVYDAGVEDGVPWQALEHVDGPTLLTVLRSHPQGLGPAVAAALGEQVAGALAEVHAAGLVHRDVKPSNLLLARDGAVKLTDFGVVLDHRAAAADDGRPSADAGAEVAAQPIPHAAAFRGTRAYAAPEQLTDPDAVDPRVDVFALGVVLHECLTGRPAFPGGRPDPTAPLLPPRRFRSDVPKALDAVVARATAVDPAARHPDGGALAVALRPLVASDPVELTASLRTGRGWSADDPDDLDPASRSGGGPPPTGAGIDARMARRWLLVGILLLALVGLLTELATRSTGDDDVEGPLGVVAGVPVRAVEVYDPYGSISRSPAPELIVDGDPATVWRTPGYPVPLRSLATPGVGVWVDVGEPRAIETVELDLVTPRVSVELLVRDEAPGGTTTEADWAVVDALEAPGSPAVLRADGRVGRYWLVWFTELELDGEAWSAALADLRFTVVP